MVLGGALRDEQLGGDRAELRDHLRDVILDAWLDSKSIGIGYPTAGTTYDDYLAGKVPDPWLTLHGA